MMRFLVFSLFSFLLTGCGVSKSANTTTVNDIVTVYLVRHAEKQKGEDPMLTEAGVKRAEKLVGILKSENIAAVYSTDYNRTKSTAAPTAAHFKLEPIIYNHKLIDINEVCLNYKGKSILVVGHSNSTPKLANDLLGVKRFEKFDESDYTNILKVTISGESKEAERMKFESY